MIVKREWRAREPSFTLRAMMEAGEIPASGAAPVAGEPVFRARGITKVYLMGEVEVRALQAVDLDLLRGEFVVILGPSGSGKSTLLNILGGLDVPTSGKVHFLDHDLSVDDEEALTRFRREHVGFVFQFYNLIPSLTAIENVALITEIADAPMAPGDALRMVGLGHRLDHFPAQLSGGEQQRVAIARASASWSPPRWAGAWTGSRWTSAPARGRGRALRRARGRDP